MLVRPKKAQITKVSYSHVLLDSPGDEKLGGTTEKLVSSKADYGVVDMYQETV